MIELAALVCSMKKSSAPYSSGRAMLRSNSGFSTLQFCKRVAISDMIFVFFEVKLLAGLTLYPVA